jgi:hypothetical protein
LNPPLLVAGLIVFASPLSLAVILEDAAVVNPIALGDRNPTADRVQLQTERYFEDAIDFRIAL